MTNVKSFIVGIIIVASSVPFWFFYREAIGLNAGNGLAVSYALILLTINLAATALLLLFAERARILIVVAVLNAFSFLYFFGASVITGIGAFFLLAAVWYAYERVHAEIESRITFNVSILLRQGMPSVLTALAIALALGYFVQTAKTPERITIRDIIPRAVFEAVFENTVPYIGTAALEGFSANLTVDEYIERQLTKGGLDITQLPAGEREQVFARAREELFRQVSDTLPETSIQGDTRIGDVLYDIIIARSEQVLAPYQQFIPFAFAFGLFLFLRTVALPYGWAISWIIRGAIALLRRGGVVVRTEEQAVKERMSWA